jgi:hypothetical protein
VTPRIGVLAYGSLIQDPGAELAGVEAERRSGIRTPFRVEFARSSAKRSNAPTLVPVDVGGAHVEATIIVLQEGVSLESARDIVYRREIGKVGDATKRYRPDPSRASQVYVEAVPSFADLDWVLFTRIAANIEELNAERLAQLAIESARGPVGVRRDDGIMYVRDAMSNGIRTPLLRPYVTAILERTGASSLDEAWDRVQETEAG